LIVPDDRRNAEHSLRHGALGLFAQRPLDVRRLRAGDHSLSVEPDVICQLRYHVGIADVHLPHPHCLQDSVDQFPTRLVIQIERGHAQRQQRIERVMRRRRRRHIQHCALAHYVPQHPVALGWRFGRSDVAVRVRQARKQYRRRTNPDLMRLGRLVSVERKMARSRKSVAYNDNSRSLKSGSRPEGCGSSHIVRRP
jgi:hypothetical protein